jgi:hypothetical protein
MGRIFYFAPDDSYPRLKVLKYPVRILPGFMLDRGFKWSSLVETILREKTSFLLHEKFQALQVLGK